MEEMVTITKKEYDGLKDDEKWRNALENGGVDNWDWYGDSLRDAGYYDEEEN